MCRCATLVTAKTDNIPNRALEKQTVAKKEMIGIPKESFLDLFLTLLVIAKTDNAKRVIDR